MTEPQAGASPQPSASKAEARRKALPELHPKAAAVLPRVTVVAGPKRPVGRIPLILAIIGVIAALVTGGLYLFRDVSQPPSMTPEETVREFLSAVFLASSPERVAAVVCANWDPGDAIERTRQEIDTNVRVSWDEFGIVTADAERITMRVRLGLRLPDDLRPTTYAQWRFNLVHEDGWRVCEARPFVA